MAKEHNVEELYSAVKIGNNSEAFEALLLEDGTVHIYNGDCEIAVFDNISSAKEKYRIF